MPQVSLTTWNSFLRDHPEVHFLQTGEWGELKSGFGWEAVRTIVDGVGVQILFRHLGLGLTLGYMPKAAIPARRHNANLALWNEVDSLCRSRHAILCKIEPDEWETAGSETSSSAATPSPGTTRKVTSPHNIQPRRTIIIDLRGTHERMLARMRPKCRYNIGLAQRRGVAVEAWDDVAAFHTMMQTTGKRDGFSIHTATYYRRAFELFRAAGMCELLVAKYANQPLSALMVFARGKRAWYVYGGSSDVERSRMPNYLLQWEAMCWAKSRGCQEYDFWGVPDEDEPTLEANFEQHRTGLWGIYKFKRGFGGEVRRAVPAVDRVYRPLLYRLYLRRMTARDGL
jgi:lipid II:glycine glycyltransferase (peptidoglycan interpeptide bridge formation enzyme)